MFKCYTFLILTHLPSELFPSGMSFPFSENIPSNEVHFFSLKKKSEALVSHLASIIPWAELWKKATCFASSDFFSQVMNINASLPSKCSQTTSMLKTTFLRTFTLFKAITYHSELFLPSKAAALAKAAVSLPAPVFALPPHHYPLPSIDHLT